MTWVRVDELAEAIGVPKTTIYQRSRAAKAAPYTRTVGGNVEFDLEWYRAEAEKIAAAKPARTVAERVAADRRRNDRKNEAALRRKPPMASFDGDDWAELSIPVSKPVPRPPRPPSAEPATDVPSQPEFIDYLDEKRKWSARIEEIKYKVLSKAVVDGPTVRSESFAVARLARDQLLAIPDRVSGLLAGASTTDKCFEIVDREIRRVLSDLCDSINALEFDDKATIDLDEDGGE